ncbi:hypothetical protein [Pseudonocardia sp. TRM90224]|uniref:hypothetical protein n=1 Tax=Pseudonocardia sp. TRM90224 TaxID=2812678 RepID=UPI001E2DC4AF|nr:hypothetical protein [Pseudonocardia sp. TRM90224]
MMAGPNEQTSMNVSIAEMSQGVSAIRSITLDDLAEASPAIKDEGERLVASAEAFQPVNNFEGTALLTAFVGLAVECQKAGHRPSWFDAERLRR